MSAQSPMTIEALLDTCSIKMYQQPIPSIRRQSLVGVEALCRGIYPDGSVASPGELFMLAQQHGLQAELDSLCLDLAFEQFLPLLAEQSDLVLFLNVSAATLEQPSNCVELVGRLARQYGVDPRNVAIEIPETELGSSTMLHQAVQQINEAGFLVVLDDIGVKQSNLDRIVALRPDILKIDRALLNNIHRDTHKQEVFKALVRMSERIGGWVIAEGIEQEEEALVVLEHGGDIMQGYYFGVPAPFDSGVDQQTSDRMQSVAHSYKAHALQQFREHQDAGLIRLQCARDARSMIEHVRTETFDRILQQIVNTFPIVQSACMLDAQGMQISDTCWQAQHVVPQKMIVFHPPTRGTDHSLKEYVYLLPHAESGIFETMPYVPLPTAQLCITVSCMLRDADDVSRILCMHLNAY